MDSRKVTHVYGYLIRTTT